MKLQIPATIKTSLIVQNLCQEQEPVYYSQLFLFLWWFQEKKTLINMQLKYEKEHLHASVEAFQTTYNSNICLPLPRSHFSLSGGNRLRLCLFSAPTYNKKTELSVSQSDKCCQEGRGNMLKVWNDSSIKAG